jgi:glycosyltransferase involved in cell wall biosynthesis
MEVEVLTTCIIDIYDDWDRNYHEPGMERSNGVLVRRFPMKRRKGRVYARLNRRLMAGGPLTGWGQRRFLRHMFRAPALYRYIERHQQDYWYICIPFMFASTYHAVLAAPTRSLIIPCLHDDGIYDPPPIYRKMFRSARGLLFNTDAEARFAASLIGPVPGQVRRVMGEGIETDAVGDGDRFRRTFEISGPVVLYAGRREDGKNVPLLIEYRQRYTVEHPGRATLVLIGSPAPPPESDGPGIRDLGFVPMQDKYDAFAAADLCCQPSVNESFSLVVMESWVQGSPVLVHGDCAVTSEHCEISGGGLAFTTYEKFAESVDRVLDDPADARSMGQRGRQYVLDRYQWPTVVERYQEVIAEIAGTVRS